MTKKWVIGGALAVAALAGWAVWSGKVHAADLAGGNCCSDLEERIAELESSVARKGNKKVTLTISGEVNKAILWTDGLAGLPTEQSPHVIDGGTKIRLKGEATISPTIKAGMIFEYGFDDTRGQALGPAVEWLAGDAELRRSAVYLKTALGTVTLGKDSLATDAIVEIDVSNTRVASRMLSLEPLWSYTGLATLPIVGGNLLNPMPFHDLRANALRYDSPLFFGVGKDDGLRFSASWAGATVVGDDVWDAAVRYSGEFSGVRVAAGAGYRTEKYSAILGVNDQKTLSGSGSVMHVVSGLFVTIAAADQKDNPLFGYIKTWQAKAGWEKNISGLGSTTFYGEYAEHKLSDVAGISGFNIDSSFWGAGVVQAINAADMDLYLSARQYKSDIFSGDATVVMGGARLKF